MITLSMILSFVAFMTETGGVPRSGRKGGGRLRDLFVCHMEQYLVARSPREDDRKLN